MLMLITYDISLADPEGQTRLRRIANTALIMACAYNTPYSNATSRPTNGCS